MNDKQCVAEEAVRHVQDGMLIGLGTGSTANAFIEALARRYAEESLRIRVAASSVVSTIKAQELGLPLVAMEHLASLDLYVDGADEVSPELALLKGRGSDLVREKLLARASDRFLVLVDESKLVARIGERYPIPVEVMPFAWQVVLRELERHGAHGGLRPNASKDGLAVTSHGSLVLDMRFPVEMPSAALNAVLDAMSGVVEHGIFHDLADAVLVVSEGHVRTLSQASP